MKISNFEEILAWQKAKDMAVSLARAMEPCKDFAFRNQIWRSAISISNNIAEGFERQSIKEFRQFLYIAKGSAAEVRSMLYLAADLGLLHGDEINKIGDEALVISKMISKLIAYLNSQIQITQPANQPTSQPAN